MKKFPYSPEDYPKAYEVLTKMCKMWTNFAKYGNPTPATDNSIGCEWAPVKPIRGAGEQFELDYLEIGDDAIEMRRNPDAERVEFWRNVYQKYNGGFLRAKL